MALQKTITIKGGYTAEYLRVNNVQLHKDGKNILTGNLQLFKDKAQREISDGDFVDNFTFSYEITDAQVKLEREAVAYEKIKEGIILGEGEDAKETNVLSGCSGVFGFQDALSV